MEFTEIVLTIVVPIVSVVGGVLITLIKNAKVKKYITNLMSITEKAKQYIIEAEKQINYTGSEKKNYVISRLLKVVVDNHIKNITVQDIDDIIENEINITNHVNIKKKSPTLNVENQRSFPSLTL